MYTKLYLIVIRNRFAIPNKVRMPFIIILCYLLHTDNLLHHIELFTANK